MLSPTAITCLYEVAKSLNVFFEVTSLIIVMWVTELLSQSLKVTTSARFAKMNCICHQSCYVPVR